VDTLLRVRSLSAPEQEEIRERLGPASDPQEIMQRVSRVLRDLSHLAVVVQAPRPESDAVSHLEFVRLRDDQLLAVIASHSGQIQNKLIPLDASLSPSDLDRINNYLNGLVSGLTLDQMRARLVREIEKERESSARDSGAGTGAQTGHGRYSCVRARRRHSARRAVQSPVRRG